MIIRVARFLGFLVFGVFVLVAPNVAVVAAVTAQGLRRWRPDRVFAAVIFALTTAPACLLWWYGPDSGPSWWYPILGWHADDALVAWLVTGLSTGPWLGSGYWLVRQPFRERSPHSGRDVAEKRHRCEERRQRWVVQVAHRSLYAAGTGQVLAWVAARFAVPVGDAAGPFLGRTMRGDLGRGESRHWRAGRFLRLPVQHVPHLVLLGATGMGKTESVVRICEWALERSWLVVYLSAKEPTGRQDSLAPRLVAAARGRRSRVLSPACRFDPMRVSDAELVDRLIAADEWTEPHYRHTAATVLTLAVAVRRKLGLAIRDLGDILDTLERLQAATAATRDPDLVRRCDSLKSSRQDPVAGVLLRYRSLWSSLQAWTGADGWAWEDADLVVAELPNGRQPEAARALMRMLLHDLKGYLRDGQRRPVGQRVLLVAEEAGAFANDKVVGGDFVELVERGRSAGLFALLTAQEPYGLGDERTRHTVLTNGAVGMFGTPGWAAEDLARLTGSRSSERGTISYDRVGLRSGGFTARQDTTKMPTQLLRSLRRGELIVCSHGESALVAAGLSGSAYGEPTRQPAGAPTTVPAPLVATGPVPPTYMGPVVGSGQQVAAPVAYGPVAYPDLAQQLAPASAPDFQPPPGQPLQGRRSSAD